MKEKMWMAKVMIAIAVVMLIVLIVLIGMKPAIGEWSYTLMGAQVDYSIGDRVTHMGHVYECIEWDEGDPRVIFPPTANPAWWAEVQ